MIGVDQWRDAAARVDLDDLTDLADIVSDAAVDDVGAQLGAVVDGVAQALATGQRVQSLLDTVAAISARSRSDDSVTLPAARGLVAAAALLAVTGREENPRPLLDAWASRAVSERATVSDADRNDWALACVGWGRDDLVTDVVGGAVPTFESGATFGPDKPSFARYLVAAVNEKAPVADVVPAWTSFVLDLPAAVQSGSLRWSSLLHAGAAVYIPLGQRSTGQVGDSIREFVAEILASG